MGAFLPLFTRASKLLREAVDEALRPHGVRAGQNLLLEALWERDGLTPGQAADLLQVATPTVVKSATRMEVTGLLTRRRDESDRRLVRLYLTDRGRSVRSSVEEALEGVELRATAALGEHQREVVVEALRAMVTELSADPSGERRDDER